jgi:curved DNA-binding protein CbpA
MDEGGEEANVTERPPPQNDEGGAGEAGGEMSDAAAIAISAATPSAASTAADADVDVVPPPPEEWEVRRDELKSMADDHFRNRSYALAIQRYRDALDLDPTNHVLLSNMSAAHLANGEKSKALHDARLCVEHAPPTYVKGHTRLAAAMFGLGRYNEASAVYAKVLGELDPNNVAARRGLDDCRAKQRIVNEEREIEASRLQGELDDQRRRAASEAEDKPNDKGNNDEDDLLDDFFSEVERVIEKPKPPMVGHGADGGDKCDDANGGGNVKTNRIKEQLNDLGTSTYQIDRILQTNYEWKNLNPFHVLDVPHTIDDDAIISLRYRALSLLVHPDKCPNDPNRAKDAFEQVRKAMKQMNDADKRRHVRALIEQGMKQGRRDYDVERSNRNGLDNNNHDANGGGDEEGGLARAQNRATMRIFAEIEHTRRDIERRKRDFEQRERSQEDEEKARERNEREYDKRWKEGERQEKRVGNWRDFQVGGEKGGKKGRLN